MDMNRQTLKSLMALVAFGVLLYWGLQNLTTIGLFLGILLGLIGPFLLGGCIAFVLNVPMRRLETLLFPRPTAKQKRYKRMVSLVLTLLLLVGMILVVFFLIVPEVRNSFVLLKNNVVSFLANLESNYPDLAQQLTSLIPSAEELAGLDWNSIGAKVFSYVKLGAGSLINSTMNFAAQVFNGLVAFCLGFIFSIYVLFQKEKLGSQMKKLMYAFLPEDKADYLIYIGRLSSRTFSNFLSGQCMEALILGTMFFIAMTVFRFPYALMIGVLIGITALIPIFGAFIGCFVGAFMILMTNPMQAVWFVVLFLILQQVEGNLIYPKVVGSSVGLPSIWVLVAVSIGGSAMGVLGMLVFIPLASVLYTLLRETTYKKLAQRKIPKQKTR